MMSERKIIDSKSVGKKLKPRRQLTTVRYIFFHLRMNKKYICSVKSVEHTEKRNGKSNISYGKFAQIALKYQFSYSK